MVDPEFLKRKCDLCGNGNMQFDPVMTYRPNMIGNFDGLAHSTCLKKHNVDRY